MTTSYIEKEKELLALETRKKIYEIITNYPGIHSREIERKSKLATGTVKHHIYYLQKHGLVKEKKQRNNIHYFPKTFQETNQKIVSYLRNKSTRRILLCILTYPKPNQQTIANFVGLTKQTTSWHLQKLVKEEIVEQTKKGREVQYTLQIPKEELVKLFITYKKSFLDKLVDRTVEMWE